MELVQELFRFLDIPIGDYGRPVDVIGKLVEKIPVVVNHITVRNPLPIPLIAELSESGLADKSVGTAIREVSPVDSAAEFLNPVNCPQDVAVLTDFIPVEFVLILFKNLHAKSLTLGDFLPSCAFKHALKKFVVTNHVHCILVLISCLYKRPEDDH